MASLIPVDGEIDEVEAPTTLDELRAILGGGTISYKHAPGDDIWIWAGNSKHPANDRATQWSGRMLPIPGPCLYCSAKEAPAVLPIVRRASGPFFKPRPVYNMNHDSFLMGYGDLGGTSPYPVQSAAIDTIWGQIRSLVEKMESPIIPNYSIENVAVGPKWDIKPEYYIHGEHREILSSFTVQNSYFDVQAIMDLVTDKSRP